MDYILLTGCTGLLGRYLLFELLKAGKPVVAVVRSDKVRTAADRVESVMGYWEEQTGCSLPRPVVLQGDLCQPNLGLSAEDLNWLTDNCNSILQCAASMTFREDKRGEPFRTNVGGMSNVLQLCSTAQIRRMHLISTAYICGLRTGRIMESDIELGQQLGNVYEQSKLRAELMARQSDSLDQLTVMRPASIVGDSRTGYVTSCHGFYLPLQLAYLMAHQVSPQDMNERFMSLLGLKGNEGKNLVPVEWVAQATVALVNDPTAHGKTYHLASEHPVTAVTIQRVIQHAMENYHPSPAKVSKNVDFSELESWFQEYMSVYESHWRDDPVFDVTNTKQALPNLPCPELDEAALRRVAQYPVQREFKLDVFEQPKPVFNIQRLLQDSVLNGQHVPSSQDRPINVQISGRGGGQWKLWYHDRSLRAFEPGLSRLNTAKCYMNSSTLEALIQGQQTFEKSVAAGSTVLEGEPAGRSEASALLSQLFKPRSDR